MLQQSFERQQKGGKRLWETGFMSWLVGERLEFTTSALQSHTTTVLESRPSLYGGLLFWGQSPPSLDLCDK